MFELFAVGCDDEGFPTNTTKMEIENENDCEDAVLEDRRLHPDGALEYLRDNITEARKSGMAAEQFTPWNPTYALFPLRALGLDKGPEFESWLEKFQAYYEHRLIDSKGGLSGFTCDNFHTVTNYAAVSGIALMGTEKAYELIDRQACYRELMALKNADGSFNSTKGQEYDIRSTFTVVMIAHTLNIMTPELVSGVAEFVKRCQGYDGGMAPRPGLESHGGYVHCGVGAMYLLGKLDELDLPALMRWISMRQMDFSGGFNGRPNKLVDSCYSWWIGTTCKIIADHLKIPPFWNEKAMADYLLRLSQQENGAFCDHPPDGADKFHTMFGLAGLCVCGGRDAGDCDVQLPEPDVVLCCTKELADKMRAYFKARPFVPQ